MLSKITHTLPRILHPATMVRRQTIGARLQEEREALGLSFKALSDKILKHYRAEVAPTTIRQIEQGIVLNPGIKTVEMICRGLELPPLDVMSFGLDDPPPESKERFSKSRFAILAEIYERLPPARKVWYDELLEVVIEHMRKG